MRDKSLRFYQVDGEDRVFFQFKKKADKLIIMGEPIGDETQMAAAIGDFMKEAISRICRWCSMKSMKT